MIRFSANLGFLWTELSLPQAIHAAHRAGFKAVECHWPYDTPAEDVASALEQTGLPMLGLNTRRGDVAAGDNGVAAVPGREEEARAYIDEALEYCAAIDCGAVHVMAGFTDRSAETHHTFARNLEYAAERGQGQGVTILIEPLNHRDAPGYHISTLEPALDVVAQVGADNIKVMFDCYHLQITQGDLLECLRHHLPNIGHIQIASVPERAEPDLGELHYTNILAALDAMGWDRPIGAEYKPRTTTDAGLGWMKSYEC